MLPFSTRNSWDTNYGSKEQKQDLMHVAVCTILLPGGYYVLEGHGDNGWPHFQQVKELPSLPLREQEIFLKGYILLYFDQLKMSDT